MRVDDLIPTRGFFPEYLKWVQRLTDAPSVYHIASALSAVSATVSNFAEGEFGIPMRDGSILRSVFPTNLWILLVGPSGDRKSTAMEKSVECVQPVVGTISAISGSPEATFDLVSHKPDIFFYHSEGATLFSQLQASYWLQGQGLLCDLYDGREEPPYVRTLTGQRTKKNPNPKPTTITIRRPRVSILIGIAPEMLDQTRRSDWTGGLIGRMMLIYGELASPSEEPPKTDDVGRAMLATYLQKIRTSLEEEKKSRGTQLKIGIRPDALQMYMDWSRHLAATTKNRPPKIRSLFRRLPMHVLRTAALYAVSQFCDVITSETIIPAIRFGDHSTKSIERVGDLLADDPVLRTAIRIRDMLKAEPTGVISVAKISTELRLSWSSIEPAIRTLKMIGYARIRVDETNPDLQWIHRTNAPPADFVET